MEEQIKFRSGLEARCASLLERSNTPFLYEAEKLDYVIHARYTPDFILPNGVYLEAKGLFKPADRRKMIAVKAANPDIDIRFIFQRNNVIAKGSKTTYGAWADKHGFPYCIFPNIPYSWLT